MDTVSPVITSPTTTSTSSVSGTTGPTVSFVLPPIEHSISNERPPSANDQVRNFLSRDFVFVEFCKK